MSLYSENYKKMMDGYNKIVNCIASVEYMEQLECIPNMTDAWIVLVDKYCDEIYYDKSNKNRKKDAPQFGEAGKEMFESLKSIYQQKLQEFLPEEYEGNFKPIRVKNLSEMVYEYNSQFDEEDGDDEE